LPTVGRKKKEYIISQIREQGKGSARGTAALAPLRCHGRAWRPAVRQRLLQRGVERAAFTVLEMPSCVLLLQGLSNAGVESGPDMGLSPRAKPASETNAESTTLTGD